MIRYIAAILISLTSLLAVAQDPDIDSLMAVADSDTSIIARMQACSKLSSLLQDAEQQYIYSKKALDMAISHGSDEQKMIMYQKAGYSANMIGDQREGLDYSFKSLRIADSLGNDQLRLQNLLNIGTCYSEIDQLKSLEYYNQCISVAEKIGNYSTLESVYYNIGLYYLDCDVKKIAIENFEKSRKAYLKSDHVNESLSAEYDLFIMVNKAMYFLEEKDTLLGLALTDSLNNSEALASKIDGFAGEANHTIGMVNCNLASAEYSVGKPRDNYLHQTEKYLKRLMRIIDQYNVQWLIPEAYNEPHTKYLLETGRLREAGEMLKDPDNYLHGQYDILAYLYFRKMGQYAKALNHIEKYHSTIMERHSMQNAVHFEELQSQIDYERHIEEIQRQTDAANSIYEQEQRRGRNIRIFILVVLSIVAATIVFFLYSHHSNNKIRETLTKLNQDLAHQNASLINLREEILVQTEEIQNQNQIIEQQRDTLAEANKSLKYSISMGRNIQRALIWDEHQLHDELGDSFVFWKPLHVVSGDFYWFSKIAGRDYILVADCTGHGVPGALLSMYGIAMMNDYVKRNSQLSAASILELIKEAYLGQFVRGDVDLYDGMDCALLIIDREAMTVEYSGARRPLVQVTDGEKITHRPDKISIGINPLRDHIRFTNHIIPIHKGDMLYAFSDGISDQFGGDDGTTKFGNTQLLDILGEVSFLETTIQKKIVESVVINWRTGPYYAGLARNPVPQLDDQLLIGVRI